MDNTGKNKIPVGQKKKLEEARKSLKRMQKEIEPFIKRRDFVQVTTAGKWCETSDYCLK